MKFTYNLTFYIILIYYDFLILRVSNCFSRWYQVIGSSGTHWWPLFSFRRRHNQIMLDYKINYLSPFNFCGQPLSVRNYNSSSSFFLFLFFFLYCWRYNPQWVLAFSVIFLHSVLSLLIILHPLIPIIWISSSTSSIHLFLGLSLILLPIGFHSNILLGILPPSIPHSSSFFFINLTMSSLPMSSFSSCPALPSSR